MRSRSTILFSILITLTVGLFLLDLAVGAVNIPIRDGWAALTGGKDVYKRQDAEEAEKITDISALASLKEVTVNIVIRNSYNGADLTGLDNICLLYTSRCV